MFAARRALDQNSRRTEPSNGAARSREDRPRAAPAAETAAPDWARLVSRIRSGEQAGMEDLYRVFSRGVRYYLCRQLGPQELDDRVHDVFLIVVQAIQRGDLREPERLMGFVRTVVRRQVAAQIDQAVHSRKEEVDIEVGSRIADGRHNPERRAAERQQADLMKEVLQSLSAKDQEILTRFYLNEQSQEEICQEMSLNETQFRLLKSRAKARFGELGRKKLHPNPVLRVFLRTSSAVPH